MFKKIVLAHRINKFYKIFGEALNSYCHTTAKDLKDTDFILGVKLDILEALEAQRYTFNEKVYPIDKWLNNLYNTLELKGE